MRDQPLVTDITTQPLDSIPWRLLSNRQLEFWRDHVRLPPETLKALNAELNRHTRVTK